jgi:hypothetical protein
MGTTKASIAILVCALATSSSALADECTGRTSEGSPFATCFDPGNRLFVGGGTSGIGGGIRFRHAIEFDDEPDLTWKLEHHLIEGAAGGLNNRYQGAVYTGRFLRHARDGHVVLPLGVPRKIFVPFDIGAEAEVGRFRQTRSGAPLELGVVRIAGLIDLSRSPTFRRRLSIGIVGSWDMHVDSRKRAILENLVAPLSMLSVNGYLESKNGLNVAEVELTGGREWSNFKGWQWKSTARLAFERVLIAVNDRPLSMVVEGRARAPDSEFSALVGARFNLFSERGKISKSLADLQGTKQR